MAQDHLPPHREAAPDLTSAEKLHLASCARCRVNRRNALSWASTAGPTDGEGTELPPGTLIGRWVVDGVLGRGGMGVVYRVHHLDLETSAAIKVLSAADHETHRRLRREGRIQANLRHPNIVHVLDIIEIDGSEGLVMDLVEGPTLTMLLRHGRPSEEQADHLARGLFAAVAAAHHHHAIHRDLKPDNVLLADAGDGTYTPKVSDFGLVKLPDDGLGQTRTGVFMGTMRYVAPEQLRESKSVDERADLFSLGAILFELASGAPAFDDHGSRRTLPPDVPARMAHAVGEALRPERGDRPADVASLEALWFDVPLGTAPPPGRPGLWSREVMDELRPKEPELQRPSGSRRPPVPEPRSLRPEWVGAGAVAVAVAAVWWGTANRDRTPEAAAASVAPSAVGPSPHFQNEQGPCELGFGPFMPLDVGYVWRYAIQNPETRQPMPDKVNRLLDYQPVPGLGRSAFRQSRYDGDVGSFRWLARDGNAVVWVFDDWYDDKGNPTRTVSYLPGRVRVSDDFRTRAVGETWVEGFSAVEVHPPALAAVTTVHQVQWTLESAGVWVEVPAGRFCSIRLRREDPVAKEDQRYWFAPGVGKVMEDSPPKEHEELVEYTLALATPR
jgi:serine/threonine protein kinase